MEGRTPENRPVGRPVPRDSWMGGVMERIPPTPVYGVSLRKEEQVKMPPARHPQSQRFHDILDQCKALHDKKQQDYGRDSDPFANVRGSTEWGMEAWVGSMIRAHDKIRRLQQYARKGYLANEGVADAFMDLINYAGIAMVLWEEEMRNEDERMARP